jgi:hypothetical protein
MILRGYVTLSLLVGIKLWKGGMVSKRECRRLVEVFVEGFDEGVEVVMEEVGGGGFAEEGKEENAVAVEAVDVEEAAVGEGVFGDEGGSGAGGRAETSPGAENARLVKVRKNMVSPA